MVPPRAVQVLAFFMLSLVLAVKHTNSVKTRLQRRFLSPNSMQILNRFETPAILRHQNRPEGAVLYTRDFEVPTQGTTKSTSQPKNFQDTTNIKTKIFPSKFWDTQFLGKNGHIERALFSPPSLPSHAILLFPTDLCGCSLFSAMLQDGGKLFPILSKVCSLFKSYLNQRYYVKAKYFCFIPSSEPGDEKRMNFVGL